LFDKDVMARGLWQGAGLLVLLLAVYDGVRSYAGSDDMARALTFTVLVLSNLCLIHANRSWGRSAWLGGDTSNRQFGWIALATVILLGCVLGVPAISRLFYFLPPSPIMLFAGPGVSIIALVWFEGVKWALGRRHSPVR
jgi:Ca2+-transporting ATPase